MYKVHQESLKFMYKNKILKFAVPSVPSVPSSTATDMSNKDACIVQDFNNKKVGHLHVCQQDR